METAAFVLTLVAVALVIVDLARKSFSIFSQVGLIILCAAVLFLSWGGKP